MKSYEKRDLTEIARGIGSVYKGTLRFRQIHKFTWRKNTQLLALALFYFLFFLLYLSIFRRFLKSTSSEIKDMTPKAKQTLKIAFLTSKVQLLFK